MEAVIKIGGSLQDDPASLKKLCGFLNRISKDHRILIVPGGGAFAELVRKLQAKHKFSDRVAHSMAIQGMEMYGLILHSMIEDSVLIDSLAQTDKNGCRIFLPYKTLKRSRELEASWRVTSDSIAAWVSSKIGCKKLVLVKMVDGIFNRGKLRSSLTTQEVKGLGQSIVDPALPEILERTGMTCWIVNGKHPDRLGKVLNSRRTVCTTISTGD